MYLSDCAHLNDASRLSGTAAFSIACVFRGNVISKEQEYPTCLLCCEPFKVVQFVELQDRGCPFSQSSLGTGGCFWPVRSQRDMC